jgi:hypothetical protein
VKAPAGSCLRDTLQLAAATVQLWGACAGAAQQLDVPAGAGATWGVSAAQHIQDLLHVLCSQSTHKPLAWLEVEVQSSMWLEFDLDLVLASFLVLWRRNRPPHLPWVAPHCDGTWVPQYQRLVQLFTSALVRQQVGVGLGHGVVLVWGPCCITLFRQAGSLSVLEPCCTAMCFIAGVLLTTGAGWPCTWHPFLITLSCWCWLSASPHPPPLPQT